jgi:hypothetical protein
MLGTNMQLDEILRIVERLCDIRRFSLEFTAKVGDFEDLFHFRLEGRSFYFIPVENGKIVKIMHICDLHDHFGIYDACMLVWKQIISMRNCVLIVLPQ